MIFGVSGSPRKNGNTDVLLSNFAKGAQDVGADVETIYLRDYVIQPCVGCEQCRKDKACTRLLDGMQLLYPKILAARGIILGSPTHNYNVTAWVKAFIDRLYCFYDFTNDRPRAYTSRLADQGRKAIVFSVCEQPDISEMGFTLEAMRMPLEALGYEVVEKFPVTGYFDRGVVRKDEGLLSKAFRKGRNFARMVGEIPPAPL
jgi:multimeric flavodoxin WrbA